MKAAKRTEKEIIMADDPLSDLSMKPSRDDMVSRQQGQTRSRRHSVETTGSKPRSMAPAWMLLLLIVAGAGAGAAGGWYLWQQIEALQARLVQSTSLLEESQSRLGHLQSNIESQNQNLSQSGNKVESELDVQMSEIRKLWDVAYKRNKPDIEKNTQNIAGLTKSVAELSKSISGQNSSLKQVGDALAKAEASLGQLQSKYTNTDKANKNIAAQIDQLSVQLKELSVQNETLKSMINVQDSQIKRLSDATGSKMEQRLYDLEIAIKAIDAHRRQVNGRLDSIDQAFRQQQSVP